MDEFTREHSHLQEFWDDTLNVQDVETYLGGVKRSESALLAPPRGAKIRNESLLYHSNHNSDKKSEKIEKKEPYKPTSLQTHTFNALKLNCENWLKLYGEERIGILTLTFKEHLTDLDEGQRRLNNLFRLINRDKIFQW